MKLSASVYSSAKHLLNRLHWQKQPIRGRLHGDELVLKARYGNPVELNAKGHPRSYDRSTEDQV